jgi:hypothetical protein
MGGGADVDLMPFLSLFVEPFHKIFAEWEAVFRKIGHSCEGLLEGKPALSQGRR